MATSTEISVLGMKPGHDGSIAFIMGEEVKFAIEAEKGGGSRYSTLTAETFLKSLAYCEHQPDIIALSGWSMGGPRGTPIAAGYSGLRQVEVKQTQIFGNPISYFSTSHERSHIFNAYGMSPYKQGQPCFALVWEGHFGAFYHIDENVHIRRVRKVLEDPGIRYGFLYALADPTFPFPKQPGAIRLSDAGKLMALCGYANNIHWSVNCEISELIKTLTNPSFNASKVTKEQFSSCSLYNCGVTENRFVVTAKTLSDTIYQLFEDQARQLIKKYGRLPLLVSGGCGLNCEWNSKFISSGLFSDVFVPPCVNDSGTALGTAIDAMFYYTGRAKVRWTPYLGEEPVEDCKDYGEFTRTPLLLSEIAHCLANGAIIAWLRGRYEIGPRALGARSILASPLHRSMLNRLNEIKQREHFRPIAPVCLEEDMSLYFDPPEPSPHMLEFRKVVTSVIPAVTHVDGTARPQSVNDSQNLILSNLLREFREITGISVLCNTSLNMKGHGFINSLSNLIKFANERNLKYFVFNNHFYRKD